MVAWEKEIIITFSNEMKLITESESEPQYPVLFLFLLPYSHGWSSLAAILVLSAYQSASVQCPLFDYIGIFFYISSRCYMRRFDVCVHCGWYGVLLWWLLLILCYYI